MAEAGIKVSVDHMGHDRLTELRSPRIDDRPFLNLVCALLPTRQEREPGCRLDAQIQVLLDTRR